MTAHAAYALARKHFCASFHSRRRGSGTLGLIAGVLADLRRPLPRLRGAVTYRDFVANIEPAEHIYHSDDVADELDAAVRAATVT